jgi:hypothetical protein
MKKVLLLVSCLSVGFIIACGGGVKDSDSAVNPFRENLETLTPTPTINATTNFFKGKAWTEGLIDHLLRNNSTTTVTYQDVKNLNYSQGSVQYGAKHFRVIHTTTDPLMSTVRNYVNSIDGIYLGTINTGTTLNPNVQMIISLAMVDTMSIAPIGNCNLIDKVSYFKDKFTSFHFKCVDPNLGIWQRILVNDPLMEAYRKNPAGVFIGKSNLFKTIFKYRNNMFFYTGFDKDLKRHFAAVDKPYFTDLKYVESVYDAKSGFRGVYVPPTTFFDIKPSEGLYFSTMRGSFPCLRFAAFGHGTTRVCPSNCPQ